VIVKRNNEVPRVNNPPPTQSTRLSIPDFSSTVKTLSGGILIHPKTSGIAITPARTKKRYFQLSDSPNNPPNTGPRDEPRGAPIAMNANEAVRRGSVRKVVPIIPKVAGDELVFFVNA
jgi:hypothetical protein